MTTSLALVVLMAVASDAGAADQALIDAAKNEGRATWYTTQIIDQFARPAAEAFERKYGIKVEYVRANSNEVALRMTNEARAGKVMADVVDGTSIILGLKSQNLLLKWLPDSSRRLDPRFVDPEGYWAATNQYVLSPGFNSDQVRKGTEPQTYEDLLNPKWKGKMAWSSNVSSSGAAGFIGIVLSHMGEDRGMAYLKKLAEQNITGVRVSARQLLDQVIAGEYAISLQIFNYHATISAAQGAPAAWIPMQPVMSYVSIVSVIRGGPNPNAGKLLMDFLVSEEGQQIYRAADYIPIDPNVPARDPSLRPDEINLKSIFFTPEELERGLPRWVKIFKEIFR